MTIHFDTLDFLKTLTAAGIEASHAEALARARAKSMDDLVSHELATKPDLHALRVEMKADFQARRAEVKSQNDAFRAEVKSQNDALRAEMKSLLEQQSTTLRADFQTELRSLKYGASIAMAFLSLVVVMSRLIK